MNRLYKLIKSKVFLEILLILVISLTPILWFKGGSLLVGHDNTYPLEAKPFLESRLYTWSENSLGQDQSLIMGTIPIHLIDAIPTYLGMSPQAGQKMVYVFWFFLMGLSMYVLARFIKPKNALFRLTAVLLYQFNFFILQAWWIGEKSKFSAYIAMPLVLATYLAYCRERLTFLQTALISGLIFFFFNAGGLYGVPLYGGLFITMSAFVLFYSASYLLKRDFRKVGKILLLPLFTVAFYVLFNAYFLFPALLKVALSFSTGVSSVGGISGVIEWAQEISANTSFINLIRLQGIPEWYDNPSHPYAPLYLHSRLLIVISFIWPVLILSSLLVIKKSKDQLLVLFFAIVYLLGLLFAAGTHPPLGFVYKAFVTYVPGFAIFRTPYFKFAPAIFISSSILIAYLLDYLKGWGRKLLFVTLFILVLGYHFPFFTGEFFSWREGFSTRLEIPNYVTEFGDWLINEKEDDYRVLLLPENNNNWLFETYVWGYLSLTPVSELFGAHPVVANNTRLNQDEQDLVDRLYLALDQRDFNSITKLSKLLGVKYFLVRNDVSQNEDFVPPRSADTVSAYLNSQPQFSMLRSFGQWDLYTVGIEVGEYFESYRLTNHVDSTGNELDLDGYLELVDIANSGFVTNAEFISADSISQDYIIPECLTCKFFFQSTIRFPFRSILPSSPLYPIVSWRENAAHIAESDYRGRIYTNLGLTLKRIGELRSILSQNKDGREVAMNLLADEYREILAGFKDIPSDREKITIGSEVAQYLAEERIYLEGLYGTDFTGDRDLQTIGEVLDSLNSLRSIIKPYNYTEEGNFKRVFVFSVPDEKTYDLYIGRDELGIDYLDSDIKEAFNIVLDGQTHGLSLVTSSAEWLRIGEFKLASGEHQILIDKAAPDNRLTPFSKSSNKLLPNEFCYESQITDFNPDAAYKLNLRLQQGDTDELSLVTQKIHRDGKLEEAVYKPFSDSDKNQNRGRDFYQFKFDLLDDIDSVRVMICTDYPDIQLFNNKVSAQVAELIEQPVMFVGRRESDASELSGVEYIKHSPTGYTVSVSISVPSILVFSQRFDSDWKLSRFDKSHFVANNYSNGWYIDEPGEYELELSYYPQKVFYIGVIVSTITAVASAAYIYYSMRRRKTRYVS